MASYPFTFKMATPIIRISYRKIIDSSSTSAWDRLVIDDTYTEFLMQSQFYNQEKKYHRLDELIVNVPGAEKLHFLVSSAVIGYLKQLNGKIPGPLNSQGKYFLTFTSYRFEIIHSDIRDKTAHRVAVIFYSEPLIWHTTVGDQLLVSPQTQVAGDDGLLTELVQLQPSLSIYSFKSAD